MQTFLPYPDFKACAEVLDTRRLGKQRSEALQVLRALHVPGHGWRHHPAVKMWRGFDEALIAYGVEICEEWVRRGHADTVLGKLSERAPRRPPPAQEALARRGRLPHWLGDVALHRSHQSALVRKDPGHYAALFPGVPPDLPYLWPAAA